MKCTSFLFSNFFFENTYSYQDGASKEITSTDVL